MGKNQRHKKNLKAEKAKVKLKAKKLLPKGQNITNTSFKVKQILIRGQLKQHEDSEILSRRKLNVKDLLTRLQHHNSTIRQEAVKELKDLLQSHPIEILSEHLNALLQGISSLALDKERDIRRDSFKVLALVLGPISNEQLEPFADILISYLCCAMTHIVPTVKEDSLYFLDVLAQNCSSLVAKNSRKILPKFLDLISKHHAQSHTRQLVVTLNSKNTSNKWRIKVFERLSNMLVAIINELKSTKSRYHNDLQTYNRKIIVDDNTTYIPLNQSNKLNPCRIYIDRDHSNALGVKESEELEEFKKYIVILMPLMYESWLEVRPKRNSTSEEIPELSGEAAIFLKAITSVIFQIINYIELLETKSGPNREWFQQSFQSQFSTYFLVDFPYNQLKSVERPKKHQSDFREIQINDNCLEQNFQIAYIFLWMMSVHKISGSIIDNENREICEKILDFINERLNKWTNDNCTALPQLVQLLKILFITCNKVLYKSGLRAKIDAILRATVTAASTKQPKKDFQGQLFTLLTDIIFDNSLEELHNEFACKEFIKGLPDLLLKPTIQDNVIQVLNRIVLQHRDWISRDLVEKQEAILQNVNEIHITGGEDEKRAKLMICNLFNFIDGQIYF